MTEVAGIEVATVSRRLDGWILVSTLALVSLGALMVYSASTSLQLLGRQILFTFVGLVGLGIAAMVPYRFWARIATPIAAGSVLLLIAVRFLGSSANGAQRWFEVGSLQIQPSEIAKLSLAIYFAVWLTNKGAKIKSFRACTAPFGLILALVCFLIVAQPDLGTAIVIASAMVVVFFIAGARLEHLGFGVATGFVLALPLITLASYRNARLKVWLDPWQYASGLGFQTAHALEALGSGGIFGKGLGNSIQKTVLPAPSTDSIFAVTGEELGLVGTVFVVGLFLVLAWRGFNIARMAPDNFARLLAVGITGTIVIQAFLNVAVITNSVPFTGVPLPFISYGGSSLVVSLFSVGILLNISREANRPFRQIQGQTSPPGGRPRDESRLNRGKDRRPRLPGLGRGPVPAPVPAGVQIIEIWGRRDRRPRYG